MEERLKQIKHNIKSGRLQLRDLHWLVEQVEKTIKKDQEQTK